MTRKIPEDTPRTLLVALGAWAIAAVVAGLEGVFAKLSVAELAGLGTFAFAFATATLYLDDAVRTYLQGASTRRLLTFAIEMDLGIAVGTMLALGLANGNVAAALTRFPLAVVIVFAIPVAAAGHVLLAERVLRRRPARAPYAALPR
jgi:hypothetical protein